MLEGFAVWNIVKVIFRVSELTIILSLGTTGLVLCHGRLLSILIYFCLDPL